MTIYRGFSGVNREIKQQFRGLGGVNREVKEQYRGAGGANRKVFESKKHLYNLGDECTALTGGWLGTSFSTGSIFTKNSDNIALHSYRASAYTANKIDLTNYTTLKAYIYTLGRATDFGSQILMVGTTIDLATGWPFGGSLQYKTAITSVNVNKSAPAYYTITLDVSALNGSYYVALTSDDSANSSYMNIYKVWLE